MGSDIISGDPDSDQVTQWVQNLRGKDRESARQLWNRYFDRLIHEARRQLGRTPQRHVHEEDVAASVFASLCRGAENGRFDAVGSRDELWRLLIVLTRCKVIDRKRRLKRIRNGGGKVAGESIFLNKGDSEQRRRGLDGLAGNQVSPEDLAIINEECQRLLLMLRDDTLRTVATCRLEGFSNEEIANRLQISIRSVERKLRLIRDSWLKELPHSS